MCVIADYFLNGTIYYMYIHDGWGWRVLRSKLPINTLDIVHIIPLFMCGLPQRISCVGTELEAFSLCCICAVFQGQQDFCCMTSVVINCLVTVYICVCLMVT